jgi:hypothetical protein
MYFLPYVNGCDERDMAFYERHGMCNWAQFGSATLVKDMGRGRWRNETKPDIPLALLLREDLRKKLPY